MKSNFDVKVRTKSGGEYQINNVEKIDYNFLNGTIIRLAKRTSSGKRSFEIFFKDNVENIDLVISSDPGNSQPKYYTNNAAYDRADDPVNNDNAEYEETDDENNSDDIV